MGYPTSPLRGIFVLSLLSAAVSGAIQAQTPANQEIEEVIVRAHPLSAEGLAQPISVLTGDALRRVVSPSLAETLRDIPGVHSSNFGQAVGRPVIRGLGGPRVKVMEDRIDSLDVSVSSPDHMTMIEPFTAQSIEVLKGPSTLLYGSGAIGGVVDVHTGRIPHEVPDSLSGSLELRDADNADQQTAAGRIDGGVGSFAFHADGFYRSADEYEIPGYAESAAFRAQEEAEGGHDDEDHDEDHDEEHEDEHGDEEAYGVLPNSQLEAQGGAIGGSYVGDRGFFGISLSSYDAEYGLPGHSHGHHEDEEEHGDEEHDEEAEEGGSILDLSQTRFDIEAGLENPFAGISAMNFRLGYNDYEHVEFEGSGEEGTVFATKAFESRLEFTHEDFFGFEGATGVQLSNREFSAIGEEAFVQPVDTQTLGLFYVGQRSFGSLGLEAGVRYEHVEQDPTVGSARDFNLGSASLGLIQPLSDGWILSGQLDYSSRAPVAEELFSDGPHLATQTFEIGDRNLNEETAANLSAMLRYDLGNLNFSLSAYITEFDDFIYEANTGLEMDELPVLQWTQADATLSGFEADATWQAMNWQGGGLSLSAGFDTVTARLDSGANRNIPRIPPQRLRLGAVMDWNGWLGEVSWRRVGDQNDTGLGEIRTEGFDDLRLHINYTVDIGVSSVELFLSGRNLTDDEQRYHTTFIKDLAPQPGRTIEAGVRVYF
ncbi:MAG: iron complex outermembrane receptor protein [Pseudohongiellaceae bacterium]|jgi:iron complex outermembrane receptor protein